MNYKFIKPVLTAFAVVAMSFGFVPSVPTYAANPTIPSASSSYNLDLTACRLSFKWEKTNANDANERNGFIEDLILAGQTKNAAGFSQIPSSNPYIDQGCVAQPNLFVNGTLTKAKYSEFDVGPAAAKAAFGNDPVLGIKSQAQNTYDNNGTLIASSTNFDRSVPANLPTAFTGSVIDGVPYLDRAYASNPAMRSTTAGAKTYYLPRPFWGGVDVFENNVYFGGPCKIENGLISVRNNYAGGDIGQVDWSSFGLTIDQNNPTSTCARRFLSGVTSVENRSLKTFQYIFEKTYPTPAQCTRLQQAYAALKTQSFPNGISYGAEGCDAFYRRTLGANLVGSRNGTKTLAVTTFYSMYDDGGRPVKNGNNVTVFNWLGWVNPDVGGPRKTDSRSLVRGYDGYSTFAL